MGESTNRKRVVFDTGVLVSALGWEGNPSRCWELVLDGRIDNLTSEPLLAELERVLEYDRFGFDEEERTDFYSSVVLASELVEPTVDLAVVQSDPEDNKLFECAIEGGAECLLSSNTNHVMPARDENRRWRETAVLTPSEFLQWIDSGA